MIPLWIFYVNEGLDRLSRAVRSIDQGIYRVTVLDMSETHECADNPDRAWQRTDVTLPYGTPFTTAQNYIRERAVSVPMYGWMHADAESIDGASTELARIAHERWDERWGWIFTEGDALCLLRTEAVLDTGPWDTGFYQYGSDTDYNRRMARYGWAMIDTEMREPLRSEGPRVRHETSTIYRTDPAFRRKTDALAPGVRAWYTQKWGGWVGAERFATPWDGQCERELLERLRAHPAFERLRASVQSTEGNLLDTTNDRTACAQIETLQRMLRRIRCSPKTILEIGTNKGMFGLFLLDQAPSATLYTIDINPDCANAAGLLSEYGLMVAFVEGDSAAVVPNIWPHIDIDMAWIDGGHTLAQAASDVGHAMSRSIPLVLVDDTNVPEVEAAVTRCLAAHPEYEREPNTLEAEDERRIAILSLREGSEESRGYDFAMH